MVNVSFLLSRCSANYFPLLFSDGSFGGIIISQSISISDPGLVNKLHSWTNWKKNQIMVLQLDNFAFIKWIVLNPFPQKSLRLFKFYDPLVRKIKESVISPKEMVTNNSKLIS